MYIYTHSIIHRIMHILSTQISKLIEILEMILTVEEEAFANWFKRVFPLMMLWTFELTATDILSQQTC